MNYIIKRSERTKRCSRSRKGNTVILIRDLELYNYMQIILVCVYVMASLIDNDITHIAFMSVAFLASCTIRKWLKSIRYNADTFKIDIAELMSIAVAASRFVVETMSIYTIRNVLLLSAFLFIILFIVIIYNKKH